MSEGRVLVVEDETIVAMDIAATLRRLGYTVAAVVSSGEEAVERASKLQPDVILMDVRLQGRMDGIEAARIIHDRHEIPIVFLTAHADLDTVERAKTSSPYGYLIKPFDERDLPRALDLAMQRRRDERARSQLVQDALWESEERFRLVIDSLREFGFSILDLRGVIVTWSRGAEEISGYKASEVLGRPLSVVFPNEIQGSALPDYEELMRGEAVEFDAWRTRRDGTRFLAHIFRCAMRDRTGSVCGFVTIVRDITTQRALEEHVRDREKIDGLGKLAGGIAHDFNNMLMVIFSRVSLLQKLVGDSDPLRRYVNDIGDAAKKNASLTQQLLAAARKQVLQLQPTRLNDVVTSTMQLLRSSIGEDISIRTELDTNLWQVFADAGQLNQVLMNLVLNARDAMPRGGALTVETHNYHASGEYARVHPQVTEGDYVVLIVSDNGEGMPAEVRERIFDPFYTTKSTGTGLGLAVVRGIVEQMHGRIWVYSEPGQGTAFKIFFPRYADAATNQSPAEEAEQPLPSGHETILLVEDEALVRMVIRETLEEHGYRVIEAESPAEAIARSGTHNGPIDLLLTDVIMPGMNGRELGERLLLARPDLRVVFMSGYTNGAVTHHGILEPGVHFLEKPASMTRVLETVRAALSSRG